MLHSLNTLECLIQERGMPDIVSVNPARPTEIVASFAPATAADVDAAVARAAAAQREWAAVPIPARAEVVAAIRHLLAQRKAELSKLVSREAGKVIVEAA